MKFRQKFLLRFLLVQHCIESHCNLRRCNNVRISLICTLYHGIESISFIEPKIWNILPDEIKQQISLNSFKRSLKNGSHKIARVDFSKFILMVSVSFLSCHNYTEIYCGLVFFLFYFIYLFFYPTDIEMFTISTLIPEIMLLC